MLAEPLLLFLLLFSAAGLGWGGARWYARRTSGAHKLRVSPDYFKGLNFLLDDKPDKAIEVFIAMMEVDNETVDTHFALGSLFRRRGEVDRAIRIHQNIIARPTLPRAQRDQALLALAEDYLRAGLLDRAEKLFLRLADSTTQKKPALARLTVIYEQQRDWQQAIATRRQLPPGGFQPSEDIIGHYYCELAADALKERDFVSARALLKKAKASGPWSPRSALMRAQLAAEEDDSKTAARLYRRVVERDPRFLSEVWPALRLVMGDDGARDRFGRFLESLVAKQPAAREPLAYAAILHADVEPDAARRCVREFLDAASPLHDALTALGVDVTRDDGQNDTLADVVVALAALLRNRPAYLCEHCGYASEQQYWQCPGCKNWDTIRPNALMPATRLALMAGR